MGRRIVAVVVVATLVSAPASAQWVVFDPANYAQAVLIAQRTLQTYQQLQAQYQLIMRMSEGLRGLDRYRIPEITMSLHDTARSTYGRRWLEGLNGGDPRATAYMASVVPLQRPGPDLARLSPAARRIFENIYATVEVSDSVASMGGHQVALMRGYHGVLQRVLGYLEQDILSPLSDFHQMTAVLDKISAGELVGRRQDMASNQLLSHALEQLIARNKRQRDTEAGAINMQLATWRDASPANVAFRAGTGDALTNWRQP